ncbi:MAG: PTS sugar transporter subunit IIB [Anaerostipes sp.]|nr:PTS sugar transporter subunit IIB [Anaerostipes sp.]
MKKILIACGSGVCTSTVANQKITEFLNSNGYEGQFKMEQCKVAEIVAKSENYDFCIATTTAPKDAKCPVLAGLPLLTGMGMDKLQEDVLEQMKK